MSFDDNDAEVFGLIRANFENRGWVVGACDMQIAAQAVSRGLILVTNNMAEFSRIQHLELTNWI